jgi:hypothetical protein
MTPERTVDMGWNDYFLNAREDETEEDEMSHSDMAIEGQQKAEVEKSRLTHAFDVMRICLKLWYLKHNFPRNVHATASGFRSVVNHLGQQYEVIVNPLYKYSEENK